MFPTEIHRSYNTTQYFTDLYLTRKPRVGKVKTSKVTKNDPRLTPLNQRTKNWNDLVNPSVESSNKVSEITHDPLVRQSQLTFQIINYII
jgi:hypothetical protein